MGGGVSGWDGLVGAKTLVTCAGLQTTPSQERRYRAYTVLLGTR